MGWAGGVVENTSAGTGLWMYIWLAAELHFLCPPPSLSLPPPSPSPQAALRCRESALLRVATLEADLGKSRARLDATAGKPAQFTKVGACYSPSLHRGSSCVHPPPDVCVHSVVDAEARPGHHAHGTEHTASCPPLPCPTTSPSIAEMVPLHSTLFVPSSREVRAQCFIIV